MLYGIGAAIRAIARRARRKLIDSLLMLFHECEKYSDISKVAEDESDEIYSLDLVSTKGSNIHSQTFRLPESEMQKAEELERASTSYLMA